MSVSEQTKTAPQEEREPLVHEGVSAVERPVNKLGRFRWMICALLFFACVINYMDRNGYKQCVPHNLDPTVSELPSLDFSSGYVQRSIAKMPKQGSKRPWRLYQNYALDIVTLRYGKIDDGVMRYS